MSAAAMHTPRRGRLATWFGASSATDTVVPISPDVVQPDTRALIDRRMYDEIGEFLFAHRLAPTPIHFELAHGYISGSEPVIARAIGAMLTVDCRLDPDAVAALSQQVRRDGRDPRALESLADQLEARLGECLSAADRTQCSARDYGDALDRAQTGLDTDPIGTLQHIAGLTREVLSTTRAVESELRRTREEAERLRSDLEQARQAAERDHLTGLPNRRGFERRLDAVLSKAEDAGAAPRRILALCDIDDFKRVNDVHGHPAGDRVLKFVGTFLAEQLGEDAYVARHGGEEFAILIEGHSSLEALTLLDDVRERLGARSLVNQESGAPIGRVTFSAGIANLDGNGAAAIAAADAALYRAKHAGKNGVCLAPAVLPSPARSGSAG